MNTQITSTITQPSILTKNNFGYHLDKVLTWGRSYTEYQQMFALEASDLSGSIVDIGSGTSNFNAELLRQRGQTITSCDPIYAYEYSQVNRLFNGSCQLIRDGIDCCYKNYNWGKESPFTNLDDLLKERKRIANCFLKDYSSGKKQKRYVAAELPTLPFTDKQFSLALCSYFLFTYSDNFDGDFHCAAITELLRVAREVRIFPVFSLSGNISLWLPIVQKHFHTKLVKVPYHFQKGANQFLHISAEK